MSWYPLLPRRIRGRTGTLARGLCAAGMLLLIPAMNGCSSSTGGRPAYTLSASPGSLQVPAGGSGYAVVSVVRTYGFAGAVTLSIPELPAGVVASGEIPATETTGYLTIAAAPAKKA